MIELLLTLVAWGFILLFIGRFAAPWTFATVQTLRGFAAAFRPGAAAPPERE